MSTSLSPEHRIAIDRGFLTEAPGDSCATNWKFIQWDRKGEMWFKENDSDVFLIIPPSTENPKDNIIPFPKQKIRRP